MKRYFMIGLVIVLVLSLGAIFYGAWLNERGEFQIARRMENRTLLLHGERARRRFLRPRINVGVLKLDPSDMADAMALIEGRIVECRAPKGSLVKKGDVIFVLENENIPIQMQEAEANILQAQAQLKRAENTFARYKILKANEAVSAQQYDEAEAGYLSAQSQLEVAEARLSQLRVQEARQQVTAPLDGKVLMLYRQPGTYVQGGTSLALVGSFDFLYFRTRVEDKDARHLDLGLEAEMTIQNTQFKKVYDEDFAAGNLGIRQCFMAKIINISPPLSEPAVLRSIQWQVDNRAGLLEPQTYGGVSFQSTQGREALTVPLSSMTNGKNNRVFVARDGIVERRAVTAGTDDGTYIEILSGLSDGEVVVTSGTEGLTDGARADVVLEDEEKGGAQK